MPIYLYECESCGHRFEADQSIKDEPLTECCYVDSEGLCFGKVHRVMQPVGIAFKGSGFYTTDYRSSRSS